MNKNYILVNKAGGSSRTVDLNVGHRHPRGTIQVSKKPEEYDEKLRGHSSF
jgi:hypothetical protein